ncbi:MAG: SpoIIE family protein phosphatase [Chthoniobacteraceae bacterium]
MLPAENHRELAVSTVRGGHVGEIPKLRIPFEQSIRDWVENYRQAISEGDEQAEQRLVSQHPLRNFTDGIAIPMLAAGKLIGILNFASTHHRHLPTPGQLKTLNILASTASSALAEARMMEHLEQRVAERTRQLEDRNRQTEEELKMAHELQLAMLPSRYLNSAQDDHSLVRFHSVYRPAGSVSGDFFDVIELTNNRIGIFIGDAMGHDVRAALITTMMRALVQELSTNIEAPGALMAEVNRYMATILKHSEHVMFATASYLVLDPDESRVLFANAAHPAPIHLRRQQGEAVALCHKSDCGPALGLFHNATYKTGSAPLDQSDCFMLFTDGLFEIEAAAGKELYSQERLRHFISRQIERPAEELVTDLFGELETFSGQASFSDDVCLLAVEVGQMVGVN